MQTVDRESSSPTECALSPADLAPPFPRETTTIERASARLGISRSLGFQLAREGRFPVPVIRAGRRLLVPIAALDSILANGTARSTASNDIGGA